MERVTDRSVPAASTVRGREREERERGERKREIEKERGGKRKKSGFKFECLIGQAKFN